MGSFDGMGALESRLEEARRKKVEQERRAAAEAAARQADRDSRDGESSELVREFIARARKLQIRPTHRLLGSVEQTWAGGGGLDSTAYLKSEKILDRTTTNCWHLGGQPLGKKSIAYPDGLSFHYYLTESGMNLIPQESNGTSRFAFIKAEMRAKRIVTWVPRKPHVDDVVKSIWPYESQVDVMLGDAMVEFFQDHPGS
ncbi:hypothetical protein TV39_09010 [Arthrobacter sp. SPG23]|uniref:hypothetical protein n=1 Tax=Arthrobacter sp. SPG23 TaxID=1610703 RepID=UPI0005B9ACF1|nr:hypothetical protein [Arthrobacter sp. SPG23]KIS27856.1 hypothetical protein TV39_09010 [Arthrobacter sp. SPG23]